MSQTGSRASSGWPVGLAVSPSERPGRSFARRETISAMMESEISSCPLAPIGRPAGERTTFKASSLKPRFLSPERMLPPRLDRILVELPEGGDDEPGVSRMGNRSRVQPLGGVNGEEPEAQRWRYGG